MTGSYSVEASHRNRSLTSCGSVWRCSAAGVMTSAIESVVRMIATRCTICPTPESFSSKPSLNTAISWKPKRAWIPGSTVRHSSSRCAAAESSEICSFLPVPMGFWSAIAHLLASGLPQKRAEGDGVAQLARRRDAVLPAPSGDALHLVGRARRELEHDRLVLARWIAAQAHARPAADGNAREALVIRCVTMPAERPAPPVLGDQDLLEAGPQLAHPGRARV